jgi:hypothetical protein
MKYIRTSFSFPEDIYNALMQRSQEKQQSLIKTLLELVEPALEREKQAEIKKSHKAIEAMMGISDVPITDLSENIDVYLYGDKSKFAAIGKWKKKK